jgi:O-antigen/teichoic acid export membrane protein
VADELSIPHSADRSSLTSNLKVAKNTIVLVALRVLLPALAVGLVLLLSRYLGADGLGRYTLAFSFLYLFNSIAPLGLGAIITRDGARDRAKLASVLGNSMTLGTVAAIAMTILMSVVACISDYDQGTREAIVILSLALIPYTIGLFQDSAFISLERMDYLAMGTVAEYFIKVGGGIILLYMGYGLNAVLILAVVGRIAGCIISAELLRRLDLPTRWTFEFDEMKALLKLAPTFLLIGIFATLYWRIDIFMLSKLQSVEQVGYYGAAWRILELAMVLPQSLCLSLYPQIAESATSDLARLRWIGHSALRYLLAISIPIAIGVTIMSESVLELLYGPTFRSASYTLGILILTLIPYGFVRFHAYLLVGLNRQRIDLVLNVIMALMNILLNLALIPKFGHLGAAIATFAAICLYGVLQYGYLRIQMPNRVMPIPMPFSMLSAVVAFAIFVWMFRHGNVLVVASIAALLYVAWLLMSGFFTASELKLFGLDRIQNLKRNRLS